MSDIYTPGGLNPNDPIIFNEWYIPGKIPSLNELNAFRAIQSPAAHSIFRRAKKRGKVFNLYNTTKSDWKRKVIACVLKQGFEVVHHAYFHYLVIENNKKRDPSNVCSACVKFVEDGLTEAGVIPNDGWKNVLGIRTHWFYDPVCEPGIYVMMSDIRVEEEKLPLYYKLFLTERYLNV